MMHPQEKRKLQAKQVEENSQGIERNEVKIIVLTIVIILQFIVVGVLIYNNHTNIEECHAMVYKDLTGQDLDMEIFND